ncbi:hypothetical protein FBUS_06818 [Fasciolopsis buskii]|uniref:Transmembrane protein n=1 Tax=Fasciolopsis buskii TaxID=27845 RepID=A0A8E0RRL5_9TREM|nr:hypothetical protein FBUS_06818 [Fasciolopsis buski]
MATPVFDEYLGPLQERDEKRRKLLVRKLKTSIALLWLGFGAGVAGGIALVVCFPKEDLSKNGGRIAGIVCLILSIPFFILGSIMISVFILVKEAIDETREPKLFRTEELQDLMYPRQQSPATLERLNFPSYMEPLETADKLSEDCEEPPPDYFPQVDLPAYPGSPQGLWLFTLNEMDLGHKRGLSRALQPI